mmetsp:Transcript_1849/g.2933  ORF Transcript_1849/g.2933 Transcript_1849/m.2933 type:complete len:203 (+) Transcript_1849:1988-2596(+)
MNIETHRSLTMTGVKNLTLLVLICSHKDLSIAQLNRLNITMAFNLTHRSKHRVHSIACLNNFVTTTRCNASSRKLSVIYLNSLTLMTLSSIAHLNSSRSLSVIHPNILTVTMPRDLNTSHLSNLIITMNLTKLMSYKVLSATHLNSAMFSRSGVLSNIHLNNHTITIVISIILINSLWDLNFIKWIHLKPHLGLPAACLRVS